MYLKKQNIDMLHGTLIDKILLFTIPIALSSMLQQLFNAADTAVIGLCGDAAALAAVGINTEIVALIVSVSSGLGVGANLLVAGKIGRGETDNIPETVQAALFLSLLTGIAGCTFGQIVCRPLLMLMRTPAAILDEAALYLRIYLAAYPFLLLYDFASAILRACGDSHHPFAALTISGAVNVVLNLFFVTVLHLNVAGVALATAISTALSAVLVLKFLFKDMNLGMSPMRFMQFVAGRVISKSVRLSGSNFCKYNVMKMLQAGIPAAVQGAVFCFANIFIQASVNTFGENAIAGSTIAINFEYFTYYIITAFGQTATTFTGQNFAAGQKSRCRQILIISLVLSTLCSTLPIFTIVFFRNFFSGLFTSDAAIIKSATLRILCILLYEPMCSLYEIPAGCLRGRGHSFYPAAATMSGTCALRVLWIFTVFQRAPSLPMLYHIYPLSWIATILLVNIGFYIIEKSTSNRMA